MTTPDPKHLHDGGLTSIFRLRRSFDEPIAPAPGHTVGEFRAHVVRRDPSPPSSALPRLRFPMFRSLMPVRLRLDASLVLAVTVASSLVAAASCATSQQGGHGFPTTGPDSSVQQGGDDGGGGSPF